MKNNRNKIVLVVTIATIVAIISILHVFIGFAKTPRGFEYLWTGHYFLDYFVYLQALVQGIRGHWLVNNPFATDDPTKTFLVWWPYIIIGKIAALFHISAITAYWMAVFFLSFLIVVVTYILISRLLSNQTFMVRIGALLFSLFATPFVSINKTPVGISVVSYDFWYAPSNIFKRFEFVPHHLLGNLLILILLILISSFLDNLSHFKYNQVIKKVLIVSLIVIFALSFYPYNVVVLLLASGCCGVVYFLLSMRKRPRKNIFVLTIFFAILSIIVIPMGLVIKNLSHLSGVIERISSHDLLYINFPKLSLVALSLGPLLVLAILGMKDLLNKFTYSKLLLILFVVLSYIFSFTKLSFYFGNFNLRFQTPIVYILLGVLGVLGILRLRKFGLGLFIALMLYFTCITFFSFKLTLADTNLFSPITYLPEGIIKGYQLLDKQEERGHVLVPPNQMLGMVVPIYSDRSTYVARPDFTPDYIVKNIKANNFYLGALTKKEALDFLKDNKIKFVVLTSIEGYKVQVLYNYPFLKEVYKKKDIVIFKIV